MQESNLDYVLNFQRHEWKYFVPNKALEGLIPELLLYMDLDPHSEKVGFYNLYSIYYDTEDWQSFYEKIDGIERRKKFRIRSYSNNVGPKDTVFLEVKEKNKDIILKRRLPINYEEIKSLNLGLPSKSKDSVLEEWRYNILRNSIKPKILIAYKRMAFVPRDNINLRITLDTEISYAMMGGQLDFNKTLTDTMYTKEFSVIEIKYSGTVPKFVEDLIRRHNLRNEAISKYADSVISYYKVLK